MYENDGNNALKQYEYIEVPAESTPRHKKEETPASRRRVTAQKKALLMVCTLAVFAMAAIFLMFRAVLNTEYRTLSQKKDELSSVESKVEQLSSEIEGSGGVMAIDEKAAEMGLHEAYGSQIVYISLDSTDKGEVLAEDNSNSGIRLFFNKVAAIAEYLY